MPFFPLIKGFREVYVLRAFFMNTLAATIIAILATKMDGILEHFHKSNDGLGPLGFIDVSTERNKTIVSFFVTFFSGVFTYCMLYLVFGFGYGMTATKDDLPKTAQRRIKTTKKGRI
ncbi:MAG: hypothetical protein CMD13_02160 [Flavobacteriales bacterium]|nr:hypothetical protein [Flavobacteriales bacterium]|tara:strand:+ start:383 stop:733 length:351 start_codon:yes stop_codon:yes gene_type:complete